MTFLNTSLIRKLTLFLGAAMLSVSAMAADFNQTQRLASQGDAIAQAMLGLMYDQGKVVPQDYRKAFYWYQKAANQGDSDGQFSVGAAYYQGQGVPQDYSKAFYWVKKSANQNNGLAQTAIGAMYEEGEGVRQNKTTAKEWYGKGCDNGSQIGCDQYKRLNQKDY